MEMVQEGQNKPKIAPKLINLLKIAEEEKEDRVSALPDCSLLEILSRLPTTKVVIRTGILSKRWKHLWTSVPCLIFTGNHPLKSDFVSLVNKTPTQFSPLKLKKFKLNASYDTRFKSDFNSWIRYAIICHVEEINLRLRNAGKGTEFVFEQFFFINTCFTDLKLSGCILNPIGAISWKNLRSLRISYRKLDEELIENILSGSPQLETLVLEYCYGYRLLNITSKSVKKLVFFGYVDHDDEYEEFSVEINAPNILSLTIESELVLCNLFLLNVSSLVEAKLDFKKSGHWETTYDKEEEEMLKRFILNLGHVKVLKIEGFCSEVVSRLEAKGFIFPSNVKFPDVTCDWSDSDSVERKIRRCSCLE